MNPHTWGKGKGAEGRERAEGGGGKGAVGRRANVTKTRLIFKWPKIKKRNTSWTLMKQRTLHKKENKNQYRAYISYIKSVRIKLDISGPTKP